VQALLFSMSRLLDEMTHTDVSDLYGEFGEFGLQNRLLFVSRVHIRLFHLSLGLLQ